MKNVLITGRNSYIGTSFEQYAQSNHPGAFAIDAMDMVDGTWREKDFSGYDTVFHVAGIAHSDNGRISQEKTRLYYAINTELAVETAKKAKQDGVGQFIFMSSSIVYGESAPIGGRKVITRDTPACPANCYGDSKLQAEKGILALEDENFRVVILRPPMIYGRGSKGNYPVLSKFARKMPVFPKVENQRSMLYIENFCEFVYLMVENGERGTFWPQNAQYSNTSEMVRLIAQAHGKRVRLLPGFGWLLKLLSHTTPVVNKAFGNLCYDQGMSAYSRNYQMRTLEESIEESESEND